MLIQAYMHLRKNLNLLRCTREVVGKATDKKGTNSAPPPNINETILGDNTSSITFITVASLDCTYVTKKKITPVLCMKMKQTLVLEIRDRNSHSKRIHKYLIRKVRKRKS